MAVTEKYSLLKRNRINLRDAIPLAKPFTILFEPASLCNFRCACCFYSQPGFLLHHKKGRMIFEDFRRIADDLAAWKGDKIKVIRLIGFGEPLLNPETPRMVKYLTDLQVAERIEITTNASLLTPEISRQLIESGLDYIRCSIYSTDQRHHEELTRSKVNIEAIRSNVASLKKLRISMGATNPFIYVKMLKSSVARENELFLEQYSSVADEVALEEPHQWLGGSAALTNRTRRVCPQPFKMLSILFNGDVILCDPDWQKNTCIGNALHQKISALWGGDEMRKFWRLQLENRRAENKSCRDCTFLVDDYVIDDLDGVSPAVLGKG